jgi:hypothetical protein
MQWDCVGGYAIREKSTAVKKLKILMGNTKSGKATRSSVKVGYIFTSNFENLNTTVIGNKYQFLALFTKYDLANANNEFQIGALVANEEILGATFCCPFVIFCPHHKSSELNPRVNDCWVVGTPLKRPVQGCHLFKTTATECLPAGPCCCYSYSAMGIY